MWIVIVQLEDGQTGVTYYVNEEAAREAFEQLEHQHLDSPHSEVLLLQGEVMVRGRMSGKRYLKEWNS